MNRIAALIEIAALSFLAWRVAGMEQRERALLRALKQTAGNVDKMAAILKEASK